MYAAPFDYVRAGSWDEAVGRLQTEGGDAMVIAGGQSLAPMLMLRMAEPAVLVDIGRAAERTIAEDEDSVVISALARHAELGRSPAVARHLPVLADAARHIGNVRVRTRGTIGGSLANAEPSAELPCVAVALGARIRTHGPDGGRVLAAADLFVGHFQNSLGSAELITHVEIPKPAPRQGAAFVEWSRRPGDYASVEATAVVTLARDGRCATVRVVLGAISDRPVDVSDSLGSLVGGNLDEAAIADASRAAAENVTVEAGTHGSAEYRRGLVKVIVERALRAATARARKAAEAL